MTQTTLSVDDTSEVIDALNARFPKIIGPRKDDICYATTNRQEAVRDLAGQADLVLVVGSKNSSNSNRLAELAQRVGKPSYLIDSADDINPAWLRDVDTIGLTAGASAPDVLVQQVISRLQELGADEISQLEGVRKILSLKSRKSYGWISKKSDTAKQNAGSAFFVCSPVNTVLLIIGGLYCDFLMIAAGNW